MSKHHNLIDSYDVINHFELKRKNEVTLKPIKRKEKLDLDFIDEEFIEKFLLGNSKVEIELNDKYSNNNDNFNQLLKCIFISGYFYIFFF